MAHSSTGFVLRNRHFFVLDILAIIAAGILSFAIRLDLNLSASEWTGMFLFLLVALPLQMLTFYICGMYHRYWHDAGASDLLLVAVACAVAGLLTILATTVAFIFLPQFVNWVPHSIPFIDNPILTLLIITLRFSQHAYHQQFRSHQRTHHKPGDSRVLIVGAGDTGIQVLNSLEQTCPEIRVVGFLDDDLNKIGNTVHDISVVGKIGYLKYAVQQYAVNLVIIAMPSAPGTVIRRIVAICQEAGVAQKTIPSLAELINGHITVNVLRPVSIDDLLRRPLVQLDVADIQSQIAGRCVMITGAGGSIGSELVRQVAQYNPSTLLLVGHGENSLFATECQLRREFPGVRYHVLLADVRDAQRLRLIFDEWRPKFVFHAAAHKHVPMLETNIVEAVVNNVIGTNNLIDLCNTYEVERMVMLSTDKAVAPTSVMGMTKRIAEILMMSAAAKHPRRFAVVRFGNVLGSRGSVVPTFQQQIAAGGPLTVTSEKVTRFFMSIPEAVRLVLKASMLTEHGPLFVLNMGEQIRIIDLAHDLIRLNGLEPGRDIEVKVTELRRGEKMYEELFWSYEGRQLIEQGALFTVQLSVETQRMIEKLPEQIHMLMEAARNDNVEIVSELLQAVVFTSPDVIKLTNPGGVNPLQLGQLVEAVGA